VPNPEEWQNLLANKNVFVFLGFEAYINGIGASQLASTLCTGVEFACIADRTTNSWSNRRQSKEGNKRSAVEASFVSAFNTGLLLAVRGITATMLNSHAIASMTNAFLFGEFWNKSTEAPAKDFQLTIGDSYRWTQPPPPETGRPDTKTGRKKIATARSNKSRTSSRTGDDQPQVNVTIRSFDRYNSILIGLPWLPHSAGNGATKP